MTAQSPISNLQSPIATRPSPLALSIVLALMLAYSVYFSALSIQRHHTFRTYASDMGQMDQALWNTLHGHWLEDTRPNGVQMRRLTHHVELIFFVIPLVFLIHEGIESLFVVQSVAIALGALPIFWISRRKLQSEWWAIIFVVMYLMFPALQAANLAEFHAITFAPAPLLFAYHYGEERAWKRYALFSLIALAVKEDVALLVFTMSLYFGFRFRVSSFRFQVSGFRFRPFNLQLATRNSQLATHNPLLATCNLQPLVIAALALVWFYLTVFVIIPHFQPRGEMPYVDRYPRDVVTLLTSLLTWGRIEYLLKLLASVGFLALFDPIPLLVGAPSLLLNLLSNYEAQYSGTYHYSAPVAPYFVLAAIGGAKRILDFRFKILDLRLPVIAGFTVALGYHLIAGYTPIGGEFVWHEVTPHHRLLARFTAQIPRDVPVMTTSTLFPHVSHRRVVYRFGQLPVPPDTQFILLDVSQARTNPVDYVRHYRDALDQGFGIRDAADGYILLQRGLTRRDLPDEFFDFLRARTTPQYRLHIDFEDKLRFLGYDVAQDDWQRVYLRLYWTRLAGLDNNFALFPFYPDENGAPRADAQLPDLMFAFWYPTLKWKEGEVIVVETIPIDVGARAKIGLGVFFGATWDTAEFYLTPHTTCLLYTS
ncbi:MAG: DUF2079 domain-containing protein, partial [Anaerolineae bacterium]|nr:DUF2079 domain-containing protein [Anaerolineae bacterium]